MVERRLWIRLGLVVLAVPNLVTGVWAVADPLGWYQGFPGLGRHWISVDGPFNRHLIVDAGAGFLAVGVLAAVALVWARREVIQAALVATLVHAVPHFVYHATHRPAAASSTDLVMGAGALALAIVVAGALLAGVSWGTASAGVSEIRAKAAAS